MDYLHAEDGEYQVQHSQEHHGDHLHAEKLDKVQHNTEQIGDHLHVEEDENQVKPNPEHHDFHLHAGEGEDNQTTVSAGTNVIFSPLSSPPNPRTPRYGGGWVGWGVGGISRQD